MSKQFRDLPVLHLLLAVLGRGLCLVEPSQAAVVTLIESPGFLHREILLSYPLQHRGQGHLVTTNTLEAFIIPADQSEAIIICVDQSEVRIVTNDQSEKPHLGPGQQGGVRHIKLVTSVSQSLAPSSGLLHPLGGQVGVIPATEPGNMTISDLLSQSEALSATPDQ